MKRKYPSIDLMNLYANGDHKKWNSYLLTSRMKGDIHGLEKTLYGLQAGMKDLADKNLNTDKINVFFIRLQRSIENTLKEIMRDQQASALDKGVTKAPKDQIDAKRKRDQNLELYLRKNRF